MAVPISIGNVTLVCTIHRDRHWRQPKVAELLGISVGELVGGFNVNWLYCFDITVREPTGRELEPDFNIEDGDALSTCVVL